MTVNGEVGSDQNREAIVDMVHVKAPNDIALIEHIHKSFGTHLFRAFWGAMLALVAIVKIITVFEADGFRRRNVSKQTTHIMIARDLSNIITVAHRCTIIRCGTY